MAEYKKTFTKRPSAGGARSPRPGTRASFDAARGKSFTKKPWAPKDAASPDFKTHFKATCSSCGKSCDVPFKPVNGKPVFCRDCFVPTGDNAPRAGSKFSSRGSGREFSRAESTGNNDNAAILKQLEILNAKMERLIVAVAKNTEKGE